MTIESLPSEERSGRRKSARPLTVSGVAAVIEPVARYAATTVGFFRTFALMTGVAAVVTWLVIFLPFESVSVWKGLLALLSAAVLLIPAAVLGVFWIGLRQLVALPTRLAETAGQVGDQSRQAMASISAPSVDGKGKLGKVIPLLRTLVDVRSLLMESRELMLQAVVLVRVANPIVLVVVLISCVAGGILILIAGVVGLLAIV